MLRRSAVPSSLSMLLLPPSASVNACLLLEAEAANTGNDGTGDVPAASADAKSDDAVGGLSVSMPMGDTLPPLR